MHVSPQASFPHPKDQFQYTEHLTLFGEQGSCVISILISLLEIILSNAFESTF